MGVARTYKKVWSCPACAVFIIGEKVAYLNTQYDYLSLSYKPISRGTKEHLVRSNSGYVSISFHEEPITYVVLESARSDMPARPILDVWHEVTQQTHSLTVKRFSISTTWDNSHIPKTKRTAFIDTQDYGKIEAALVKARVVNGRIRSSQDEVISIVKQYCEGNGKLY